MNTTIKFKLFGITLFTKETTLNNLNEEKFKELVIEAILEREQYGASAESESPTASEFFAKYKTDTIAFEKTLLRVLNSANYAKS